jgi:hypothetical protein
MLKKLLLLLTIGLFFLGACRKEENIVVASAELRFSTDTVFLDTVFESIGSSTYELKVYNDSKESISIPQIRLADPLSPYRLNVNGTASNVVNNVEILPEDSIYIFIEVNAGEVQSSPELLIEDQILFDLQGQTQSVELVSLAKQAIFHFPNRFIVLGSGPGAVVIPYSIINCNETWDASIPHVVYGYAVVDSGCTLTIDPGTNVHFHENSGLWVFNEAQLQIAPGALPGQGDSVTFSSDRLEPFYEEVPGQWGGVLGGLYIGQGARATINNLVLKNAVNGLRTDSAIYPDQLSITNSYILNSSRTGFYAGYSNVNAQNLVVANQGLYGFYAFGGNYEFRHCSFVNYWSQSTRQEACVLLTNFLEFQDNSGTLQRISRDLEKAYFGNCVIDGNNSQELTLAQDQAAQFNFSFNDVMLKLDNDPEDRGFSITDPGFNSVLVNLVSDFRNRSNNNYQLDSLSQLIDQGNTNDGFVVPTDILGKIRNFNGLPDLGAYERQF